MLKISSLRVEYFNNNSYKTSCTKNPLIARVTKCVHNNNILCFSLSTALSYHDRRNCINSVHSDAGVVHARRRPCSRSYHFDDDIRHCHSDIRASHIRLQVRFSKKF